MISATRLARKLSARLALGAILALLFVPGLTGVIDGAPQPTAFYTIRKVDSRPADVVALDAIVASVRFQP